MLVAQARVESLTLLSADEEIRRYAVPVLELGDTVSSTLRRNAGGSIAG